MKTRTVVCVGVVLALFSVAEVRSQDGQGSVAAQNGTPHLRAPVFVYNNWSSYDELSDSVNLTEELAMRELNELLRLRRQGVRFDFYVMDAFWFAPDGGYRTWRKPSWPDGPDLWITKCTENGIRPGLWFGTNALVKLEPVPEWRSSLNRQRTAMSFSEGGFLPHFMQTLQYWYDHGIRMFKFDFADFGAATPEAEQSVSPEEIRSRNIQAFRTALHSFRQKNPDAVLVAFNGFGGDLESTAAPFPFRNPVDLRWLEVFDALYSGDPRPSDVPQMNFWRSVDIYSDHMIRRYEQSQVPLDRLDSTAFMIGATGTIYSRKTNAWEGMAILTLARGGRINTLHGNLELLDDEQARWLAKVQSLYFGMQTTGSTRSFGGIPGAAEPYGFASFDAEGAIYTVVNPGQRLAEIEMPHFPAQRAADIHRRLLFRDAGFIPVISGNRISLGPGQLAVAGYGRYAHAEYDLGTQQDVRIPKAIRPVEANFSPTEKNTISASVAVPPHGDLRIVMQQYAAEGNVLRSWGGAPPNGTSMAKILALTATQNGRSIPLQIEYDKMIWSGLSWAVGEVKHSALAAGIPVLIQGSSANKDTVVLRGRVYAVDY